MKTLQNFVQGTIDYARAGGKAYIAFRYQPVEVPLPIPDNDP